MSNNLYILANKTYNKLYISKSQTIPKKEIVNLIHIIEFANERTAIRVFAKMSRFLNQRGCIEFNMFESGNIELLSQLLLATENLDPSAVSYHIDQIEYNHKRAKRTHLDNKIRAKRALVHPTDSPHPTYKPTEFKETRAYIKQQHGAYVWLLKTSQNLFNKFGVFSKPPKINPDLGPADQTPYIVYKTPSKSISKQVIEILTQQLKKHKSIALSQDLCSHVASVFYQFGLEAPNLGKDITLYQYLRTQQKALQILYEHKPIVGPTNQKLEAMKTLLKSAGNKEALDTLQAKVTSTEADIDNMTFSLGDYTND